jgi:hypothetical protein
MPSTAGFKQGGKLGLRERQAGCECAISRIAEASKTPRATGFSTVFRPAFVALGKSPLTVFQRNLTLRYAFIENLPIGTMFCCPRFKTDRKP